jgi:Sugar (and other) transporter.
MLSDDDNNIDILDKLESAHLSWQHIKVMLISGASFFTDAYDLFVIGVVLLMIIPIFNLDSTLAGLVASSALFGAVIGPIIFGYIGDKFGRVFSYWTTVLILVIGALGSAFSFSVLELIAWLSY